MTSKRQWMIAVASAWLLTLASASYAQDFQINLGGKTLGTLSYSQSGKITRLISSMNNTPLGVFNGTFKASSRDGVSSSGKRAQDFLSVSESSRKSRQIGIVIEEGRVISTTITPETEKTQLSDPERVPIGVVDPVTAIGRLINAQGCPKPLTIYDGRRAIALTSNGSKTQDDHLICNIKYTVIAGPGHLSPLYISSVKMQLRYDMKDGAQTLTQMKLGSGLFNLILSRKD